MFNCLSVLCFSRTGSHNSYSLKLPKFLTSRNFGYCGCRPKISIIRPKFWIEKLVGGPTLCVLRNCLWKVQQYFVCVCFGARWKLDGHCLTETENLNCIWAVLRKYLYDSRGRNGFCKWAKVQQVVKSCAIYVFYLFVLLLFTEVCIKFANLLSQTFRTSSMDFIYHRCQFVSKLGEVVCFPFLPSSFPLPPVKLSRGVWSRA